MADRIEISAVAKVIDQASAVIKGIVDAIRGVSDSAKESNSAFANIGKSISGAFGPISGMVGKATGAIGQIGSQLGQLFGPLQGLTGLAGFGGLTAAISSFASKSQDISRTARLLGVTTDALQQFRFAAGSAEVADTTLTKLRQTLTTLAKDGKSVQPTVELLEKMGINAEMIKAGKLEEILPLIAAGFEANVDPAQQAAAAQALFGKQWKDALPFLQKGTAGLAEGAAKFREYGIAAKDVAAGAEAAAGFKALGLAVENAKDQVAAALLPVFVPMLQWLTDFVKNNRELLAQVALPAFIAGLATAVVSLGVAVAGALGPWGLLAAAIAAAAVAIYQNWEPIKEWFKTQWMALPPIVTEAAEGIVGAYANIFTKIKEGWQEGGLIGAMKGYLDAVKENFTNLITWIGSKVPTIDWSNLGQSLGDAFRNIQWDQVGQTIGKALGDAIMFYVKANLTIGEWLLDLDWGGIAASAGKLFVDSLVTTFWTIPKLAGDALREAVAAMAQVDWSAVLTAITVFFGTVGMEMLRIGGELIGGLIKGMLGALSAQFGQVTEAIKGRLSGIGAGISGWFGGGGAAAATPAAAPANDNANLLQRATAAGVQTQRSEVNITSTVNAPPGSTVTTSTSTRGAPVDVGAATMTNAA